MMMRLPSCVMVLTVSGMGSRETVWRATFGELFDGGKVLVSASVVEELNVPQGV